MRTRGLAIALTASATTADTARVALSLSLPRTYAVAAVGRRIGRCNSSPAATATTRLPDAGSNHDTKVQWWGYQLKLKRGEISRRNAREVTGGGIRGYNCCSSWGASPLTGSRSVDQGQLHQQLRRLSSKKPLVDPQRGVEQKRDDAAHERRIPITQPLQNLLPTHENIYTLPNFLTLTRLIAAPIVGYLLAYEVYPAALAIFIYAGITDLVDGWIARRWNMQTVVGTIVDPMADKALMTIVVVFLGIKGALPVPLAIIILGRDILLGLSALYYRYISLPPPKTLSRYWDFSLPSAEVKPTEISKWNTFFQLGLIGATMLELAMGGFPATGVEVMGYPITGTNALELSWWIVGGTTIWSGLSYVGGRKGLRILSKK